MYQDDEDTDDLDRTLSLRRRTTETPLSAEAQYADKRAQDRRQSNARTLFTTLIVIAVLYLARPVVVPVALAILFAFLLTPIVILLERTFLRRTGAIVLSLGLAMSGLSLGGYWVYQQFSGVARELSQATTNGKIGEKLRYDATSAASTAALPGSSAPRSSSPNRRRSRSSPISRFA